MTTLASYLRRAGHLVEGQLDMMGLGLDEDELVARGMLRRVLGPGRMDSDWLVANGALLGLLRRIAGPAVTAAWANYRERM